MYKFEAKEVTENLIMWIRNWFASNGHNCPAVLGISGGKDSTITAALLAKAIGAHRVYGVAMPERGQSLNGAADICKYLHINYVYASIGDIMKEFEPLKITLSISGNNTPFYMGHFSTQAQLNIPARLRMTMLYAISQTLNGRVINTCNLSENYVGYETIFGDAAGDMSPLGKLTVTEILQIGKYLELPKAWVNKTPDDGLPGSKPDEEKLGFTYANLDKAIRGEAEFTKEMMAWHNNSSFKRTSMPTFTPIVDIKEEKKENEQ